MGIWGVERGENVDDGSGWPSSVYQQPEGKRRQRAGMIRESLLLLDDPRLGRSKDRRRDTGLRLQQVCVGGLGGEGDGEG